MPDEQDKVREPDKKHSSELFFLKQASLTTTNPESVNMRASTSIAAFIQLISLSHCQVPSPTISRLDGVQIAAIIPTEAGQIGINPVDIPDESNMSVSRSYMLHFLP